MYEKERGQQVFGLCADAGSAGRQPDLRCAAVGLCRRSGGRRLCPVFEWAGGRPLRRGGGAGADSPCDGGFADRRGEGDRPSTHPHRQRRRNKRPGGHRRHRRPRRAGRQSGLGREAGSLPYFGGVGGFYDPDRGSAGRGNRPGAGHRRQRHAGHNLRYI